jgi:hypothetical protein
VAALRAFYHGAGMSMSGAVLETERLPFSEPLVSALEHIEKRGSLLSLAPDRSQRLGLMKALTEHSLVCWSVPSGKYELTSVGRQYLAQYAKSA